MTNTKSGKWRQRFRVHPAADIFPMMSSEELDKQAADIRANGLKLSIDVRRINDLDIEVLDGRNRLEAMERAGIYIDPDIHFNETGVEDDEVVAHIISANILRRHLTKEQLVELVIAAHNAGEDKPRHDGEVSKGGRGKKDENKAAVVASSKKLGVGKRTVERVIAKARPKTGEKILREARVDRTMNRQQSREDKELQKNDRQVAGFLAAATAYEEAMVVAAKSISKFSPEATAFTLRKLDKIAATQADLTAPFLEQHKPNGKSAIAKTVTIAAGVDHARGHFIMEIIALTPAMRVEQIDAVVLAVNAHAKKTAERAASYEIAPTDTTKPRPRCRQCHGSGTITSKKTGINVDCDCVREHETKQLKGSDMTTSPCMTLPRLSSRQARSSATTPATTGARRVLRAKPQTIRN
jgi:hypothetical protein